MAAEEMEGREEGREGKAAVGAGKRQRSLITSWIFMFAVLKRNSKPSKA